MRHNIGKALEGAARTEARVIQEATTQTFIDYPEMNPREHIDTDGEESKAIWQTGEGYRVSQRYFHPQFPGRKKLQSRNSDCEPCAARRLSRFLSDSSLARSSCLFSLISR